MGCVQSNLCWKDAVDPSLIDDSVVRSTDNVDGGIVMRKMSNAAFGQVPIKYGGEGGHEYTAIGIDLGTTFSCVAAWLPEGESGTVGIFESKDGKETTPSYVAFNMTEMLVGSKAKTQIDSNAANTVFDAKRLMGKPFAEVDKVDLSHWPFHVEADAGGMPEIHVEFRSKKQTLCPEEIACEVLKDMKKLAQRKSTKPIRSAVITVPAYFDDNQRNATRRAGEMAGLEVLQIINEPTAAAIAYGLGESEDESNVLVFDLGGGTFDVSLLTLDDGDYRVRAVNGDPHLGGEDFDSRLVDHVIDAFERQHPGTRTAIHANKNAKLRLRGRCEKLKIELSKGRSGEIELDCFLGDLDLEIGITRNEFETMCEPLFVRLLEPVAQCLKDARLKKSQIDEVVLVGGSTRIPKVRTMLSEFFDGKELNTSVDPDTAVAYGAAVQAAILSGDDRAGALVDVLLCDVTPLSLGIEDGEGSMHVMIPRNTQVPCIKTVDFATTVDNQTEVTVKLCQGESKRASECNQLGTFKLEGFPRKPKGEIQVEVTFSVDMNIVLTVTAKEKSAGTAKSLQVTNTGQGMTQAHIEELVAASNARA
eukprot:g4002.t1